MNLVYFSAYLDLWFLLAMLYSFQCWDLANFDKLCLPGSLSIHLKLSISKNCFSCIPQISVYVFIIIKYFKTSFELSSLTQGFRSVLFNFLVLRNVPVTLLADFLFHSIVRQHNLWYFNLEIYWDLFYFFSQHRVCLGEHSRYTWKEWFCSFGCN